MGYFNFYSYKMKNVNLSLQIVPVNSINSYPIIDEAINVIKDSGVKHQVTPFSTIMEGPLDLLLSIVLKAKEASLEAGAEEMVMNIQIHLKKTEDVKMEDKTSKFA